MGIEPLVPSRMLVGMNYPHSFNRYGGDIGPNPHVPDAQFKAENNLTNLGKAAQIPLPPLFDNIDRNLKNLKAMGIDVVRFFLVANGFVYGPAPTRRNTPSPIPAAPFFDWAFTPPTRADPRFALHFQELLKRFKTAEMKIIPSFIDFYFTGNSSSPNTKGLAAGGRADCIKDSANRGVLINTLLADLLTASVQFKDVIYAWEVINEPIWCISPFGPLSGVGAPPPTPGQELSGLARFPEVSDVEMNTFLDEALQLIENMGFESTVGNRSFNDILNRSNGQAGTFRTGSRPQFHYYAKFFTDGGIKGARLFSQFFKNGRKAFLGEFDSDFNSFGRPWTGDVNPDTTLERLKLLQKEGCELAMLWPDKGPDPAARQAQGLPPDVADPIKLRDRTRKAIVQFTGGTLPTDDVTDDTFF
jgi:hypothetical protein